MPKDKEASKPLEIVVPGTRGEADRLRREGGPALYGSLAEAQGENPEARRKGRRRKSKQS